MGCVSKCKFLAYLTVQQGKNRDIKVNKKRVFLWLGGRMCLNAVNSHSNSNIRLYSAQPLKPMSLISTVASVFCLNNFSSVKQKMQVSFVACTRAATFSDRISPSTSPPAAACPSSSQLSSRLVVFVTFLTTKDVYTQGKKYDCLIMHCSISQTFLKTNTTLFWSIMKA